MEIYPDTEVIELEARVELLERRLEFLTEYAEWYDTVEELMADYHAFVAAEPVVEEPEEVEVYLEDLVIYSGVDGAKL